MVFKKDLTPIGKGGVIKHTGKGSADQRMRGGQTESVTGPPSIGRMMNRYPKPAPAPMPAPVPAPTMAPPGLMPPSNRNKGIV
jgi:hypothetical protein